MLHRPPSKRFVRRTQGQSLVEVGMLLGLVAIVGIGGLMMLGRANAGRSEDTANLLSSQPVQQTMQLNFRGGGAFGSQSATTSSGGGLRQMRIDPATGQPIVSEGAPTNGSVNTTSVEGGVQAVGSTMSSARELQALTPKITDPKTRAWAEEITKLVYYMGGAQGVVEGVDALEIGWTDLFGYTPASALVDVNTYQDKLLSLMRKPPKGATPSDVFQVAQLAGAAWNTAQVYTEKLEPYTKGKSNNVDTSDLAKSEYNEGQWWVSPWSYDTLVNYQELRQTTREVLADGTLRETPTVQSTLQQAQTLDNTVSKTP